MLGLRQFAKLAIRKVTINKSHINQINYNHHVCVYLLAVVFCLDQLLPSSLISKAGLIRLNMKRKLCPIRLKGKGFKRYKRERFLGYEMFHQPWPRKKLSAHEEILLR